MPARPEHLATLRLAHGNDLAHPTVRQVERPAIGSASHPLTCSACGSEYLVDVLSLDSLSTEVRRTRTMQGAVGLGTGVILLLVAVMTTANPLVAIAAAVIGGLAVTVSLAHLAITPYYLGYALRRASDGKAQPLPGLAGHRLF